MTHTILYPPPHDDRDYDWHRIANADEPPCGTTGLPAEESDRPQDPDRTAAPNGDDPF